jgi:hypothetical protein
VQTVGLFSRWAYLDRLLCVWLFVVGDDSSCHSGLKADCWTFWVDCQSSLTQSIGWHLSSPKMVEIEVPINMLVAEEGSLLRLLRSKLSLA